MEQIWAHWFEIIVTALAVVVYNQVSDKAKDLEQRFKESAKEFNGELREITKAVQGIGTQMATVVAQSAAHEKRLDRVETTK